MSPKTLHSALFSLLLSLSLAACSGGDGDGSSDPMGQLDASLQNEADAQQSGSSLIIDWELDKNCPLGAGNLWVVVEGTRDYEFQTACAEEGIESYRVDPGSYTVHLEIRGSSNSLLARSDDEQVELPEDGMTEARFFFSATEGRLETRYDLRFGGQSLGCFESGVVWINFTATVSGSLDFVEYETFCDDFDRELSMNVDLKRYDIVIRAKDDFGNTLAQSQSVTREVEYGNQTIELGTLSVLF